MFLKLLNLAFQFVFKMDKHKEFEPKLADLPPLTIRELKSANGALSQKEVAYFNVIAGIEAGFEEKRKQALRLTVKQYKDSLRKKR